MKPKSFGTPVLQWGPHDCGLASLAMLLRIPYPEIEIAFGRSGWKMKRGLNGRRLIDLGKKLGFKLETVLIGHYIPHKTRAIVRIRWNGSSKSHWCLLAYGIILDTDGEVWELNDYLDAKNGRLCGAIVLKGVIRANSKEKANSVL